MTQGGLSSGGGDSRAGDGAAIHVEEVMIEKYDALEGEKSAVKFGEEEKELGPGPARPSGSWPVQRFSTGFKIFDSRYSTKPWRAPDRGSTSLTGWSGPVFRTLA
ncbi:hypothetical protein PIB30_012413 [Stylosanthes scabra]|uniref:Uncharacterized protein n=1 Tax=Stylosanthes scabra TaxID=79078 RepID=A0ABU6R506_9FABA|nr:hypothetical protein [Stylosanthes scabra]